jgi:PAS domain S-box-containing protein
MNYKNPLSFLSERARNMLWILLVGTIYFLLARISLQLAFQSSNATPVWPPSGFAFAATLLLGQRVAPGILLGAFAANLVTFLNNDTIDTFTATWVSLLISVGNTAEALVGNYLLKKLIPGCRDNYFQKVNHVFLFTITALLMCLVSCIIGTTAIYLAGIIIPNQYFIIMFTWWTGDLAGVLLITPLLLIWLKKESRGMQQQPGPSSTTAYYIEAASLFTGLILISGIVFDYWFSPFFLFTRSFLIAPFLVWAALRFGEREVISVVIISAAIAILGTADGHGPFVTTSLNESLLSVEAFVSINCVTALLLNAAIFERRLTENSLKNARDELELRIQERTKELTNSNQLLAEAQRLAHIGSWEWDVQRNIISWSDEMYRICGVSKSGVELNYETYMNCIHPDDRDYVNGIVQHSFQHHEPFDVYHRIIRPDGVIRILHGQGESFADKKGVTVKMSGTGQDVTERKISEDVLRETTDELKQKNKELERSNSELTSFSYVASHDLQEPLRKIQTFSEKILSTEYEKLPDPVKDDLRRIVSAATRMRILISDLLSYSRITTLEAHFEDTDIDLLLQEVKNDFSDSIRQKNAVIDSSPLSRLKVIPFQFRQLLTNIISNSLKFSRPGIPPHIVIKTKLIKGGEINEPEADTNKTYYYISVADNGIGFEQDFRGKIFEIFQRLHGHHIYDGTGIGLAICKKIVENHNGFITADGHLNKGSTFHIYLPVL